MHRCAHNVHVAAHKGRRNRAVVPGEKFGYDGIRVEGGVPEELGHQVIFQLLQVRAGTLSGTRAFLEDASGAVDGKVPSHEQGPPHNRIEPHCRMSSHEQGPHTTELSHEFTLEFLLGEHAGVNFFILDSRRVLAPAPKVPGPKHISNPDFAPF